MRPVFAFFIMMAVAFLLWKLTPQEARGAILTAVRKYLLPAVGFAAAVTIALLAFAFFSNGKVI